jgi:mono/diheme cytochrome c family protein
MRRSLGFSCLVRLIAVVTVSAGVVCDGPVIGGPGVGQTVAYAQEAARARTLWDGLYTEAQAARGKEAYMKACAECHMPDLAGHEYAGALAGFGFQLKWQDASLAEVYGRIRSMPLGRGGSLAGQEYLDITSYVLQVNGYPAGGDELTAAVAGPRGARLVLERQKKSTQGRWGRRGGARRSGRCAG